ncbi:MAG: Hpt domain-containing protein [Paracoccus sp. (in: a-proteobacteria)]
MRMLRNGFRCSRRRALAMRRALVHTLKGVAASLELAEIAALARTLEDRLQAGATDDRAGLIPRLAAAAVRLAVAAGWRLDRRDVVLVEVTPVPEPPVTGQVVDFASAATANARAALREQTADKASLRGMVLPALPKLWGMSPGERDADPISEAIMRLDYDVVHWRFWMRAMRRSAICEGISPHE